MKKLLLVLFMAAMTCAIPWRAIAQPISMGDAVVTCGASNPGDPVLALISVQGANTAPLNTNWAPPMQHHSTWTRTNLGQIFGIALDPSGNIYVTATSIYGTGSFGPGGSGAVYRIDGVTGAISTFATLPNDPVIRPALGNICHDPDHNPSASTNGQFFVTNMEDGKIYRLHGNTGATLSTFDPFAADGGSAGFAPRGERVWGIGYYNNRIYFGRWQEDCAVPSSSVANQVYSIGLDAFGNFTGAATLEITLPPLVGQVHSNPVSDIEFTRDAPSTRMLLGERTMYSDAQSNAHGSRMLEYINPGAWTASPATFSLGTAVTSSCPTQNYSSSVYSNSAGGVDYGYNTYDKNARKTVGCDSVAWGSGDALHFANPDFIYGLQRLPSTGGTIANSVLIDLDGNLATSQKTLIGDVDIYKNCKVDNPCDKLAFQLAFDGSVKGQCCWNLTIVNNATPPVTWLNVQLNILTPGVNFASNTAPPGWVVAAFPTTATYTPVPGPIPAGPSGPLKFCLKAITNPAPAAPQKIELVWYGKNGEICRDTMFTDCQLPPAKCAELVNLDIKCLTTAPAAPSYTMTFNIKNLAGFSIDNAFLFVSFPGMGVSVSPMFLTFPTVAPGGTSTSQSVTIYGGAPGSKVCLTFRVCDKQFLNCCTFDTCFTLPRCPDCCDSLHIALKNTKVGYNFAGNISINTQVTATPSQLIKFNATIVSATISTVCKGSPVGPVAAPATFTSGSFTTVPLLPPPTTWGTGSVTWGTYPPGATTSSAPLALNIKLPPPPLNWKCRDTVRLCIKYTYTDVLCRTCDTTVCYTIIRYGLIWLPVDHLDPIKFPLQPGEGDDGGSGKTEGDDDRSIQSGPDDANKNATISMTSPSDGTLSIINPAAPDEQSAITILGLSLEPAVGTNLTSLQDNTTGQEGRIVDRIGSLEELRQPIRQNETRTFKLSYDNEAGALAFKNYLHIRYTIAGVENADDQPMEATIVVYARTPEGSGGDELAVDREISLTNVRTYGFKFTNGNNTSDKICRVVIKIDPDKNDGDDIVAVGPGISRTQFGLKAFKTTEENPRNLLLAEEPSSSDADAIALDPKDVVTPIYVTTCGGDNKEVTFNYTTYTPEGEVVSTGTVEAVNPLAPGRLGFDDPSVPGVINSVDCAPNPLTNMATFTFSLYHNEPKVWLTITDINGNTVANVFSEQEMISGTHRLSYDLSALPAGTYFYTLRTGTQTQTRKLQVIR